MLLRTRQAQPLATLPVERLAIQVRVVRCSSPAILSTSRSMLVSLEFRWQAPAARRVLTARRGGARSSESAGDHGGRPAMIRVSTVSAGGRSVLYCTDHAVVAPSRFRVL